MKSKQPFFRSPKVRITRSIPWILHFLQRFSSILRINLWVFSFIREVYIINNFIKAKDMKNYISEQHKEIFSQFLFFLIVWYIFEPESFNSCHFPIHWAVYWRPTTLLDYFEQFIIFALSFKRLLLRTLWFFQSNLITWSQLKLFSLLFSSKLQGYSLIYCYQEKKWVLSPSNTKIPLDGFGQRKTNMFHNMNQPSFQHQKISLRFWIYFLTSWIFDSTLSIFQQHTRINE